MCSVHYQHSASSQNPGNFDLLCLLTPNIFRAMVIWILSKFGSRSLNLRNYCTKCLRWIFLSFTIWNWELSTFLKMSGWKKSTLRTKTKIYFSAKILPVKFSHFSGVKCWSLIPKIWIIGLLFGQISWPRPLSLCFLGFSEFDTLLLLLTYW